MNSMRCDGANITERELGRLLREWGSAELRDDAAFGRAHPGEGIAHLLDVFGRTRNARLGDSLICPTGVYIVSGRHG